MIIFDANILITLVSTDSSNPTHERIVGLIEDLLASKTVVGIPAPAWAEFLCGTDIATAGSLAQRGLFASMPVQAGISRLITALPLFAADVTITGQV